jgi:thioredoxin 1
VAGFTPLKGKFIVKGRFMAKAKRLLLIGIIFFWAAASAFASDSTDDIPPVPTPELVTMVDLGAHKCIPCKMMAPIIEELQKEYAGRASIIFIDVWEHREQARRFGIRAIPTQIFYDKEGKETERHVGFLDKKSIMDMLDKLGVPRENSPHKEVP